MKKNKKFILILVLIFILTYALLWLGFKIYKQTSVFKIKTSNDEVRIIGSKILGSGEIRSTNEANLTFQTSGRLVYLPFKNGATIYRGDTIASLDTYDLQRQLQIALNNYQVQRNTFDQTQANAQNGVLQGSQNYTLQNLNTLKPSGDTNSNIINDIAKRILAQNQADLNSSVTKVEIANYALQLANLTSPIDGILAHEDVTTPDINITSSTSFLIVDPKSFIFRADVNASDIDFIKVGARAQIFLNGVNKQFTGTVENIYPQRTIDANGNQVYEVDIYSQSLLNFKPKYEQQGAVEIQNQNSKTSLLPLFLISGHNFLWVFKKNKAKLEKINLGQIHGNLIEIKNTLPKNEELITNPEDLIKEKYLIE